MPVNAIGWRNADYERTRFDDTYVANTQRQQATTIYGDFMVDTWLATNSDTVDHHLMVSGNVGNDVWMVVTIPAGSGYGGLPNVNLIAAIFGALPYYPVWGAENGPLWPWLALDAAPSSGTVVDVIIFGGYV